MSNALSFVGDLAPALGEDAYLGRGRVVAMRGTAPVVQLPSGNTMRAEMALAFPYVPVEGDELLIIGGKGNCYVIGVLKAQGEVSLRFMGDVKLQAVGGELSLEADNGVRMRSPRLEFAADNLEITAGKVVQKADEVYQRVRERLSIHCREKLDVIDEDWHTRAERASVTSRGVITINGKEVHLG